MTFVEKSEILLRTNKKNQDRGKEMKMQVTREKKRWFFNVDSK